MIRSFVLRQDGLELSMIFSDYTSIIQSRQIKIYYTALGYILT